jgi:hypothetical protein
LSLLFWLPASLALMSLIEYALHRWPMHSLGFARMFPGAWPSFDSHARLHHGRFYRGDGFDKEPDPAAKYVGTAIQPGYSLLGLSPLWGGLWLAFGPAAGLTFALVCTAHAAAWTAVHAEMHEPRQRFFARTRAFAWLKEHHRLHHAHPNKNFNALLPGADRLFGTYLRPYP